MTSNERHIRASHGIEPVVEILGSVSIRISPDALPLQPGQQSKLVLGRLLLEPGALVTTDEIAVALWGEDDRADRRNGVQVAIKAARDLLADVDRHDRQVVVRDGDAYRIVIEDPLRIDAERFKQLATRGRHLLGTNPRAARAMLGEALSAWRGRLLGEFADRPWVAGHAAELDRMRDQAEVDLNEARLALGEHTDLDGPLRRQIAQRPFDERLRGQLIRALFGAGRATEASMAFRDAFRDLGGVGPELVRLGDQVARGDLARPAVGTSGAATLAAPRGHPGSVVLCAVIDLVERADIDPGLGTITLLVDRHGGIPQPVGTERLIATFGDSDAALRAAGAIASDPRLSAKIGVHVGAIIAQGDRLIGPGPGRCWQLAEAAHPGQVLVSAAARNLAGASNDLLDLGAQRFADLGPHEGLFELQDTRGRTFAPPATLNQWPHNLPVQPTRFVGRARELATLSQIVAGGSIITLIGPGGCGKTRLALQLAADEMPDFADGAWFVELAELDADAGIEAVSAEVAEQLGVHPLPDERLTAAVTRHLTDRSALLIIDNCEQVHKACAEFAGTLLARCPSVCVVATSRRRLGIDSERLVDVQPMVTDADMFSDAVELLLDRAGPLPISDADPGEMLTHAATICRALDGLPLAIELVAGQVSTRGLAGVAAEVTAMIAGQRPLGLYGSADPLRPERQRTIESAIEWSYCLLDEREQLVLRRLAVFRGTFGEVEAQRVVDDIAGVSGCLAGLVESSMLAVAPPLQGAPRLRLLEPVRAFARGLLEQDGKLDSVRDRHAGVFLALATRTAPRLFGAEEQACLERLEADHDNLRGALAWYIDSGRSAEALRLVGVLWWLWFSHGHLEEGCSWVRRALELEDEPTLARARALRTGAHLSWWRGDFAESQAYSIELAACADAIDDEWGRAWAAMALGNVETFRDPHRALVLFEDGKRRFEALDRRWEPGYALQFIGGACWFAGDDAAASKAYDHAVEIFEGLGHRSLLASAQRGAGLMAARCGHRARGETMCSAALRLSDAIGDRGGSAQALNFLGAISRDRGDHETAARRYSEALSLARAIGELWSTCWALDGLAGVARAVDEPEIAARLFAHSGRLASRAGYRHPPHELRLRGDDNEALRNTLGVDEFERSTTEGELMDISAAVSSAIAFASRYS